MTQLSEIIYLVVLLAILYDKVNAVGNDWQNLLQLNISSNMCRYRESPYPENIFSIHASWGCYRYTRDDMFVGGLIPVRGCTVQGDGENQADFTVPGISAFIFEEGDEFNENEVCIPFSHMSKEIIKSVLNSFQNEHMVQRWVDCAEEALSCCKEVLHQYQEKENNCPATWDAWTCFDSAPAGSSVKKKCSPYSYIAQAPRCHHYSYKECFSNATWNPQTDYSTCSITPRLISRTNWHTAMLSISIIIGTPAIFLLIFYQGQLQKFTFIRNLILAIVTRNILVLISKQVLIMEEMTNPDETILSRNEWACKVLVFFEKLATNLVFACMLLEGIFLHQLLTNVFASRGQKIPAMSIYYYIAFGTSIVAALSWAVVMAVTANEYCWLVIDNNQMHWINDAPKLIMLIICTILLSHISFNIWAAFKNQDNIQHSAIRTAKAFFICIPLFGLPFLFFIGIPDTDSCAAEQVYYFCYYAFDGLQGVFVAILHCYIDKEILQYYTRKFEYICARFNCVKRRVSTRVRQDFDSNTGIIIYRRDTAFTVVDGNGITSGGEDDQNESTNIPPSLAK